MIRILLLSLVLAGCAAHKTDPQLEDKFLRYSNAYLPKTSGALSLDRITLSGKEFTVHMHEDMWSQSPKQIKDYLEKGEQTGTELLSNICWNEDFKKLHSMGYTFYLYVVAAQQRGGALAYGGGLTPADCRKLGL